MARLVLHIGTHKTGTTAIQGTLDCNRSLLRRNDVIYPSFPAAQLRGLSAVKRLWRNGRNCLAQTGMLSPVLGPSIGHHGLLSPWVELPEDLMAAAPSETLLDNLSRAHADSSRTVLLSSEEFSRSHAGRNGKGPDLAKIRDMIAAFSEIRIVCFLRHQIPFLQSLYLEVAKATVPPRPALLSHQAIKSGYGAGMFMDFNLLLDRLTAAFPSDRLVFIDYAQAAQSRQGVTGALLAAAGHGSLAAKLRQPSNGQANVSPPSLAIWAANQIAEPKIPAANLLNIAKHTLQDHYGPEPATTIFSRAERSSMAAHFEPLNRSFETRVATAHPSAATPFQLSDPAAHELVHREDLAPAFWDELTRAIRQQTP